MGKSTNNDPRGNARDRNLAKKAAAQVEREREEAALEERREAAAWAIGAKCDKKSLDAAERDRKLKLKAERESMLAQEEVLFAGANKRGFTSGKKKKGKDDVDILQAALKMQVKSKAQLQREAKIKESEERKKKEEQARILKQQRKEEEENYRLEQAKLGICIDHADDLVTHSKEDNVFEELEDNVDEMNGKIVATNGHGIVETVFATGIDDALDALKTEKPSLDPHPEKRRNALWKAFEERMLPILRVEQPGMRRSQYIERVKVLWQKSEENPDNAIYL